MTENFEAVPFFNLDTEDFVGEWDKSQYLIRAGETKFYPPFLAEHFAKHLSDKLMQERGIAITDHVERAKIVAEILNPPHANQPVQPKKKAAPKKKVLTKTAPVAKQEVEKSSEEKPFAELNQAQES
jgi:hypothetical protein